MAMGRGDLRKLQSAEVGYRLAPATVRPYAPGDAGAPGAFPAGPGGLARAHVFVSDPGVVLRESLPPRRAYADKLRDGARQNGVHPAHLARLESLPTLSPAASRGGLPAAYSDTRNGLLGRAFLAAAGAALAGAFLR